MALQRTGQFACHKQVKDIAMAAAGELYERMMGDNQFYTAWKKEYPGATPKELERIFIRKNWFKCIEFARKTLVLMLRNNDISDAMKDEIMDVLEKDNSLRTGKRMMH